MFDASSPLPVPSLYLCTASYHKRHFSGDLNPVPSTQPSPFLWRIPENPALSSGPVAPLPLMIWDSVERLDAPELAKLMDACHPDGQTCGQGIWWNCGVGVIITQI